MSNAKDAINEQSTPGSEGKILLVIRHAKSSWDIGILNDFERPLNERGKKDAPEMAARLISRNIKIDLFVSSPAKRAKKTAELFCETFGRKTDSIEFISSLYHAATNDFYQAIDQLDNTKKAVAVFSHNPGITEFVNTLTDFVKIDNIPTCGVYGIKLYINKWSEFKGAKKEFLFFDYPKNG
jgi:phosphohistidine phosphatase